MLKCFYPLLKTPPIKSSVSALGARILLPAQDRPILALPPDDSTDESTEGSREPSPLRYRTSRYREEEESTETVSSSPKKTSQRRTSRDSKSSVKSSTSEKAPKVLRTYGRHNTLHRRPCTHGKPPYKGVKPPYYNESMLFWFDCKKPVYYRDGESTGDRPPVLKHRIQVSGWC